jgi:hypothetical protein
VYVVSLVSPAGLDIGASIVGDILSTIHTRWCSPLPKRPIFTALAL